MVAISNNACVKCLNLIFQKTYRKIISFATIIKHILGTKLRVRKTFTILKGNLKVICTDGIRTHDP